MGCHFLLREIFPTQGLNEGLLHCRQTLYHLSCQGSQALWIIIIHSKQSHENTVLFSLLFLCKILFHLSFKYLMSVLLQHRVLRILWQLPVPSYFAPLWGPPSSGNILLASLFPGLCQPWLQLTFSRCAFMQLVLTPLFHVTQLCSELLWGLCRLPLSNVLVCHSSGVSYSLPPQVHELLEGMGCVFLSSVRSPAQDLWFWMLVEWMFKPSLIGPKCLKKYDTKSSLVGRVKLCCSVWSWFGGRPPGVHCVVSPSCEG